MELRYELTTSWVVRADHDYKAGWDELQTEDPATDTVCFHMQQCVEKYLKAYLVVHETSFRATHDIADLIDQCRGIDPEFEALSASRAVRLTAYALAAHEPVDRPMPTREEAEDSLRIARTVRDFVRARLWKSRRYAALMDR